MSFVLWYIKNWTQQVENKNENFLLEPNFPYRKYKKLDQNLRFQRNEKYPGGTFKCE